MKMFRGWSNTTATAAMYTTVMKNYAAFQESGSGVLGTNGEPSDGHFEVYDSWALTSGGSPNGQFFPFDGAEEVFLTNNGTYGD